MILGVGVDITHIPRFKKFKDYSDEQLYKVFSFQEITDCTNNGELDCARLATRFAAKEAFFKALSATLVKLNLTHQEFSFLFACKHVSVVKKTWDVPQLEINWAGFEAKINKKLPKLSVELSISHEASHAVAFVVLTKV